MPKKIWQLINDLTARKQRNECNIKKIVCDGKDVTKDSEISDAFNTYFTSIGAELASNIRTTNLDGISYIPPTDKVFTFSKINVDTVNNLFKTINANKATGPDNIPGRLINNELLSEYQSGFRPTYSTVTALLETTNNWCVNIDKGLLNGVIFIDLKKAFDHRYLIYTRWRILNCGQAKIEAGSQVLELTRSMIICVFFHCGNGQS